MSRDIRRLYFKLKFQTFPGQKPFSQSVGGCRERAAGYYTELAWALGEMVVEIPYLLIQASLYSLITYFMIWFEINAGARAML